jgi:hypothetical protein
MVAAEIAADGALLAWIVSVSISMIDALAGA